MNSQEKNIMISGYSIPTNKELYIGLTKIYGIGIATANNICNFLQIKHNIRVLEINSQDINRINDYISENITIGDDLRKSKISNINRLVEIRCYRGIRIRKKLPVNGQRTRTNAKTARKNSNT